MATSLPEESFRGLLLRHRGRTGLTQSQLSARMAAARRTLQDWESGVNYPTAESLQRLITAVLEAGGLSPGQEAEEAEALWAAVEREAPRMHTPFDSNWFARLLSERVSPPAASDGAREVSPSLLVPLPEHRHDWGDAPDTAGFVGRTGELTQLRQWVRDERCRLVTLLGMGGIGKTQLGARLAHDVESKFERIYWRSMRDAPPCGDWLAGAIGFLSDQQLVPPPTESEQLTTLLRLLRDRRCLLLLDNFETLFEPGEQHGRYRHGLEGYGRALELLGAASHQSCVILTSREAPTELAVLEGGGVRTLLLGGLAVEDAQNLLAPKHLRGTDDQWANLTARFGGNGLALKVVGESIRSVFGGDLSAYLEEFEGSNAFGGIRRLLAEQIARSSALERQVLQTLAVEREPVEVSDLFADLGPRVGRRQLVEAIESLRRRSLLETAESSGSAAGHPFVGFMLQSVVLEHVTERLVQDVCAEIVRCEPAVLIAQPLVKAHAKDYVRHAQERLIGQPIVREVEAQLGGGGAAEQRMLTLLEHWRGRAEFDQGHGPGNVVNLLRLSRGKLRQLDLSNLVIRQAYLSDVQAQDSNFARSKLYDSALPTPLHMITVALSADGEYLLAGTTTGDVCLWRVADESLLWSVDAHAGAVLGVAQSVQPRLAASASQDGTVHLWELITGRPLVTLRGHAAFVQGVSLSDDGKLAATASQDGTVKVWRVPSGELLATLPSPGGGVLGVALSRDGTLVAGGTQSGVIGVWEVARGRSIGKLIGHESAVSAVALNRDGRLLASASQDGTAKLWDLTSASLRTTFTGHRGGLWHVALSDEGRLVATAGQDAILRLWSTDNDGQPVAAMQGHQGGIWSVSLTANGERVATAGQDGSVRLWDSGSGRLLTTLQGHTNAMWAVALSGDQRFVASGSQDRTVKVWDVGNGMLRTTLHGHSAGVQGLALTRDGRTLASAGQDGNVKLWELDSGELLHTLSGHAGAVWDVALSADGELLVSAGYDGTIRLWDVPSARLIETMHAHTHGVRATTIIDARHIIVSGSQDGLLRLWDARTGNSLMTLEGHTGGVLGVAADAAGRLVASSGFDGSVRVWDAFSGACVHTLDAHAGGALCVALDANGEMLISGGFDHGIKLWNASSGRLVNTLSGHVGAVWGVALSADGRIVASASFDGTVRLWDVASGVCSRTLQGERPFERTDISGLSGITEANRQALFALGALERARNAIRA